jgi:hypothetical protein
MRLAVLGLIIISLSGASAFGCDVFVTLTPPENAKEEGMADPRPVKHHHNCGKKQCITYCNKYRKHYCKNMWPPDDKHKKWFNAVKGYKVVASWSDQGEPSTQCSQNGEVCP